VKILLTNDDGVRADGLAMLASRLGDLGEVWVVAPDRERSAVGHSFTLNEPLRVDKLGTRVYSVSGTPADCVYLGLLELCRGADLVLSGVNHGYNLGADIFYSGTVAGAVEAALRAVPAIAVSMGGGPGADFLPAAHFCHALVPAVARAVANGTMPEKTLLNVNVPGPSDRARHASAYSERAFRWTRLGQRVYRDQVESRTDPRGNTYYWIGGAAQPGDDPPGTDVHAIHHGLVSVTPLGLDLTHQDLLGLLPGWQLEGFDASDGELLALRQSAP
jgi:5'-nucleotidase